jgi:hypothetical protein
MTRSILSCCALMFLVTVSQQATSAEEVSPKTFVSTDVTDLWWNPNESGWGLQANQSGSLVFVTIFVYGTDGSPRWVTAQLTLSGSNTFTGPVFLTNGPYYGLPTFIPAQVTLSQVGTMTFVLDSVSSAHISYSINGVVVSKNIQRQPLQLEPIAGNYVGVANVTATGCANSTSNQQGSAALALNLTQSGNSISGQYQFTGATAGPVCTIAGTYTEAGRMGFVSGSYSCATGEVGNMNLIEITNRIGMISGRLSGQSTNAGCAYTGRFTVINPLVP